MRILMIDNYDSFTYNLVQLLGRMGQDMSVVRNDRVSLHQIQQMQPDRIVLSPGPGRPEDAGICMDVVRKFHSRIPILGVCLGHQCIGQVFGMQVVRAPKVMHGKTSQIVHTGQGIYHDIVNPFEAMRYHSLMVSEESLPPQLTVTARTTDGIVMGLRHKTSPLFSVQYHPESFMSLDGPDVVGNFLELTQ